LVVAMLLAAAAVVLLVTSSHDSKVDGSVSSSARSIDVPAGRAPSELITAVAAIAATTASIPAATGTPNATRTSKLVDRRRSIAPDTRRGSATRPITKAPGSGRPVTKPTTGTGTTPVSGGTGSTPPAGTVVPPVNVPKPGRPVTGGSGGAGGAVAVIPALPTVAAPAGGGVDVSVPIGNGGVGVSVGPGGVGVGLRAAPDAPIASVQLGPSGLSIGILGISLGTTSSDQAGTP
jgi:hypothetical protein